MYKKQNGFALGLVLVASVVVLLVMTFAYRSFIAQKNVQDEISATQDFGLLNQRMAQIFSSQQLCSCNLRGLDLVPTGPNTYENRLIQPTDSRRNFGFVRIADGSSADPTVYCDMTNANNRWLIGVDAKSPTIEFEQYTQMNSIQLANITYLQDSPNSGLPQYSAKFLFGRTEAKTGRAQSNLKSPIELTIFFEVSTGGGSLPANTISQCYEPIVGGSSSSSDSTSSSTGGPVFNGTWSRSFFTIHCTNNCPTVSPQISCSGGICPHGLWKCVGNHNCGSGNEADCTENQPCGVGSTCEILTGTYHAEFTCN